MKKITTTYSVKIKTLFEGFKNKKIGTSELAEKINISYQTIRRMLYEEDFKFRLSTIKKVAKALDLDYETLIKE